MGVVRPSCADGIPYKPPGIDETVGDWLCPCGNWNFARRQACNKCKEPKPAMALSSSAVPTRKPPDNFAQQQQHYRAPTAEFGYNVPKDVALLPGTEGRNIAIQAQAGWERRPSGMRGATGSRTGSAGGFMEFDRSAEDGRRAMQKEQDRQQKERMKAEKVKCAFCKRYSCIC